jgi:hypothetical protein
VSSSHINSNIPLSITLSPSFDKLLFLYGCRLPYSSVANVPRRYNQQQRTSDLGYVRLVVLQEPLRPLKKAIIQLVRFPGSAINRIPAYNESGTRVYCHHNAYYALYTERGKASLHTENITVDRILVLGSLPFRSIKFAKQWVAPEISEDNEDAREDSSVDPESDEPRAHLSCRHSADASGSL